MVQCERTLTKDQVAERLAAHAEELRSLGVRSLDLFGSVARGDARPESDVDLLVEFKEVPGFVGYVRLRNRLEQIRSRAPDIPWEEIIGMRNIIAHGYFEVDLEVPWKTVRLDLPPLQQQMRKLIGSGLP